MKFNFSIVLAIFMALCFSLGSVDAVGTYPAVDPNMQLYWHLNNNSVIGENSTLVVDSSSQSNNGTITNALFNNSGGYLGDGSFNFVNNNSYIQEKNIVSSTNITESLTLSFWFNAKTKTIRQALAGRSFSSTRFNYGCYIETDQSIRCNLNNASNSVTTTNGVSGFSLNEWHHFVFVYDRLNNQYRMYLDGNLNVSGNSYGSLSSPNSAFTLGRWGATSNYYFNGSLDEVIIYNKSLTNKEVWELYRTYGGCFTPSGDNLMIYGDTVLCSGSYQMNGSSLGALRFMEDGIIFNGNYSLITGNYSTNGNVDLRGIFMSYNSTIYNINISNFYKGIGQTQIAENKTTVYNYISKNNKYGIGAQDGFTNGLIFNSTFIGDEAGILISTSSSSSLNLSIRNNLFINNSQFGIDLNNGQVIYINDNSFFINNTNGGIRLLDNNTEISNNVINSESILYSEAIKVQSSHHTIKNNRMDSSQYGVYLLGTIITRNITILNNTLTNGDQGSVINNCIECYFLNNSVINMSAQLDGYNIGLKVFNSTNITIKFNNFTELATSGIISQGSYNVLVEENYFDFIPLNQRSLYSANDGYEPRCAIQSSKLFKGFYNTFGNYNLTVRNNIFDIDTPCYLYLQNQTLLNHDLVSYYYRSFTPQLNFSGKYEFYIPNYYFNLSNYANGINYYLRVGGGEGIGCSLFSCLYINYSLFSDFDYFQNINSSISIDLTSNNKSNALLFNPISGAVYGSTNTADNDGNINITLTPNNSSCVFDNANLTEGITRGSGSCVFPINVTSSGNSKIVSSSLNTTVSILVRLNSPLACNDISSITYGSTTLTGQDARDVCSNGVATFTSVTVPSAGLTFSFSNNQVCNTQLSFADGITAVIGLIFMAVMLLIIFAVVGFRMSSGNAGLGEIATAVVIFSFMVAFALLFLQKLGSC